MNILEILDKLEKEKIERTTLQNVILALLAADNNPIFGKTKLQKMVFLLSQLIPELKEETDYKPYDYGMYDEAVEDALQLLESEGVIVITENNEIKLINEEEGKAALEKFKNYLDVFKKVKRTYNNLTDEEVLAIVYTLYPEYAKYSLKKEEIDKKRKELAIRLYQKGKVSIGLAAKIANMSLYDFIELLKKKGIRIELDDEENSL